MLHHRILAVIDPTQNEQIALQKALYLASILGSEVHIFCCTYLDKGDMDAYQSVKDAKHHALQEAESLIDRALSVQPVSQITITREVYWNEDWYTAICQAASRNGAHLIVKSTFKHSAMQRATHPSSDYTLLREAPCSVLLTKDAAPWKQQRILAAVAPTTDDSQHDLLNNLIVTEAQRLAHATNFDLHLVTSVDEDMHIVTLLNMLTDEDNQASSNVALMSQRFGIPEKHVHILADSARQAIIDTAEQIQADCLVVGTTGRKGITAAIIGNTAEQVLDELDIDILTVS